MIRWPLRYAPWAARDMALGPGLIGLVLVLGMALISTRMPGRAASPEDVARQLAQFVGVFDWFLVLAATGAIVSGERVSGVYRTLFARPVNPALYFLQRWLLGALMVALVVPLLALALWPITGFLGWSWGVLVRLLILYLLLGGLTFLLSTVVQRDWAIALMIFILQGILHQIVNQGDQPWLTRALEAILPPFEQAQASLEAPALSEVAGALGYGAVLLLLAMVLLSRRPLGSGGRG